MDGNGGNEISSQLKKLLGDENITKAIHDYKAAMRELQAHGVTLAGVRDEPMLYSYLVNPTYPRHSLAEIALRNFNLNLSPSLAEAADVTGRIAGALRKEVEDAGLMHVYEEIDLPLVPVLARMEDAGVKIDMGMLATLSVDLEKGCDSKAREIHEKAGHTFNINSPKQLGDVLFNKMNLPKPVKYGKGKMISTAVDVLEELSAEHEVPRLVLEYRQLSKLKSTYVDALPLLLHPTTRRLHTTFNQTGTTTAGCHPPIRTCKTSRSAPSLAARSGQRSSLNPATCCSQPTTRKLNSACWRIFLKIRCWCRPSVKGRTYTR